MATYKCINGAYHTDKCNPRCWNGHPKAIEGKMFLGTMEQVKIVRDEWIETAMNFGFTKDQARFLYRIHIEI